jgi:hypothetical protein
MHQAACSNKKVEMRLTTGPRQLATNMRREHITLHPPLRQWKLFGIVADRMNQLLSVNPVEVQTRTRKGYS